MTDLELINDLALSQYPWREHEEFYESNKDAIQARAKLHTDMLKSLSEYSKTLPNNMKRIEVKFVMRDETSWQAVAVILNQEKETK